MFTSIEVMPLLAETVNNNLFSSDAWSGFIGAVIGSSLAMIGQLIKGLTDNLTQRKKLAKQLKNDAYLSFVSALSGDNEDPDYKRSLKKGKSMIALYGSSAVNKAMSDLLKEHETNGKGICDCETSILDVISLMRNDVGSENVDINHFRTLICGSKTDDVWRTKFHQMTYIGCNQL